MNDKMVYHIYGRKAYTEPLKFVDRLEIDDVSKLDAETRRRAGDGEWIELVAFPETSIVRVIPRGDEA